MERIIGIDYGRKRVGVAVSDPLGIFASALETVPAAKIIDYLKNYTAKEFYSAIQSYSSESNCDADLGISNIKNIKEILYEAKKEKIKKNNV